jgi:4-amino-4-deoxy-L-arabinose transferase-like glycosyltransferase
MQQTKTDDESRGQGGQGKLVLGVLLVILLVQGIALWIASRRLSPTVDEYPHLVAGLYYWQTGEFNLYNVNPPLVRLWASLPLAIEQVAIPHEEFLASYRREQRLEFDLGKAFVEQHGDKAFSFLVTARRMVVLLTLLGTLCLYWLAVELTDNQAAAMLATFVWAFNPIVLGSGALLTCDIAAASAGCAMLAAWHSASRHPTVLNYLCAGILLGMAVLVKFVWLVFLVVWPVWEITRLLIETRGRIADSLTVRTVLHLFLALSAALFVLALGYRMQRVGRPIGEFRFVSELLKGHAEERTGNRFVNAGLAKLPVPIPATMLEGLDQQWEDFDKPREAYLFGHWRQGGWRYYYVAALLIKLPAGLIVLAALGLRYAALDSKVAVWCLVPFCIVFLLVSSKSNYCEHTRYLWAVLPQLTVLSCIGVQVWGRWQWGLRLALIGWISLSAISTFPYGLAYTNEFAGGPTRASSCLAGSNVDWGQGWIAARDWLKTLRSQDAEVPIVIYDDRVPNLFALGYQFEASKSLNHARLEQPIVLLLGTDGRQQLERRAWIEWSFGEPDVLLGYSVEVYYIPEGSSLPKGAGNYLWLK